MENLAILELTESELKLSIYKTKSGRFILIEQKSQAFKLGEEIVREELLLPKTKSDIVTVLKIYRKMIETYKVTQIIAIASKILQSARNYRGFIDEIYNNTGISFSILSTEEVVKYVYNATVSSIDNSKGYFINIGAYETSFVKYNRRTILNSVTIPYGAANLLQKGGTINEMCEIIKKEIAQVDLALENDEGISFVGNGKSFVSFGKIAKKIARYSLDLDNNYQVSREIMEKTIEFINGIDLDKIGKIKGIDENDATKIASGFAIIKAFYEALDISEITISSADVREGVVHANVALPSQEKFNDLLANSIDNFYEFYKDENSINNQVYQMAIILFKQLKVMHKLPRFYVKPLRIAAYLYDSGKKINYNSYTKLGFDTILYSGLTGVTHRELLIAAFTCLCQNLDDFNLADWMRYKDLLTDEDLDAVRKLGVIVKLAYALNASKKGIISDVVCDILGDSIIMKTVVDGDPSFEIMEGMKVAVDYKKVFKKSLQII